MGVNSLPNTVTRQRRGCDLNPGPSAPESSTLTLNYGAPLVCITYLKVLGIHLYCLYSRLMPTLNLVLLATLMHACQVGSLCSIAQNNLLQQLVPTWLSKWQPEYQRKTLPLLLLLYYTI